MRIPTVRKTPKDEQTVALFPTIIREFECDEPAFYGSD